MTVEQLTQELQDARRIEAASEASVGNVTAALENSMRRITELEAALKAADELAVAYSKQLVDHSIYVRYKDARAAVSRKGDG